MSMLNLINTLSDEDTERLYTPEGDAEKFAADERGDRPEERRRLAMFISHSRDLVAFGFSNENLVWFSYTKTDDLLLTRRIYDCMKVGAFYRKAAPEKALSTAGILQRDLYNMCRIDVLDVEKDKPEFTGCFITQPQDDESIMTGEVFAKRIAVIPKRLAAGIANIGDVDDILLELEKDYQRLEALYCNDKISSQEKNNKAMTICEKWRRVSCLNMSERATLRDLYRDVCYYEPAVGTQTVVQTLAALS